MKTLFLLLLFIFIIITISITLFTLRNNLKTVETFQNKFSNAGCSYDDKFERTSGNTLKDCDASQQCKPKFEDNHPCIKNNFVDKRCKLIKIWYAMKKAGTASYYTFSETNTHIIQMKRDDKLNCQQFGDNDSELISYLNNIPISDIKDNMMSFNTEEETRSYKNVNPNIVDKLIIGYTYGESDAKTLSKTIDDMKYCVNMNNSFEKEYLKDEHKTKVIFNNTTINPDKTVNTGRVITNRFIKKTDDGYKIIYKNVGIPEISSKKELPDMSKTCNHLFKHDLVNLWIENSQDKNFHRVNFIEPLNSNLVFCSKINNDIDVRSNNVKNLEELTAINYVAQDNTSNIFELGFDLSDKTKWFKFINGRPMEEHAITICSSNQYISTPIGSNSDGVNVSDRVCSEITPCQEWQYLYNTYTETSDNDCRDINIASFSSDSYFIANYDKFDSNVGYFTEEPIFAELSNCSNHQYVANKDKLELKQKQLKLIHRNNVSFYTTNRVCSNLTPCTSNQYLQNFRDFNVSNHNDLYTDTKCTNLTLCSSDQYLEKDSYDKNNEFLIAGTLIKTKDYKNYCKPLTTCGNQQYISNMSTLNSTKFDKMFTANYTCSDLTECNQNQYESTKPTDTSDRVCTNVNPCNSNIVVDIKLDATLLTLNPGLSFDNIKFENAETKRICVFDNNYFVKKNKNLNFCNIANIDIKYEILKNTDGNDDYEKNNDILLKNPKFILKKQNKEIIYMKDINIFDINENVYFKTKTNKYPNDEFELYIDSGSCKNLKLAINDVIFSCKRQQVIDKPKTSTTDNICAYEYKTIKKCDSQNHYYDLNNKDYCVEYGVNDCKLSDEKKDCSVDTKYTLSTSTNRPLLYFDNDVLNSTSKNCARVCSSRKGCMEFKTKNDTLCELYGFETIKIEHNIQLVDYEISYTYEDPDINSSKMEKPEITFDKPRYISNVTIKALNTKKVTDLSDKTFISFYNYDGSKKTYIKGSQKQNNINSYISTDTLIEILDVYA